jgi:hypothetical protein
MAISRLRFGPNGISHFRIGGFPTEAKALPPRARVAVVPVAVQMKIAATRMAQCFCPRAMPAGY